MKEKSKLLSPIIQNKGILSLKQPNTIREINNYRSCLVIDSKKIIFRGEQEISTSATRNTLISANDLLTGKSIGKIFIIK